MSAQAEIQPIHEAEAAVVRAIALATAPQPLEKREDIFATPNSWPARGVLLGVAMGAAIWVVLGWAVVHFWQ